jgi:hypothetical protein
MNEISFIFSFPYWESTGKEKIDAVNGLPIILGSMSTWKEIRIRLGALEICHRMLQS